MPDEKKIFLADQRAVLGEKKTILADQRATLVAREKAVQEVLQRAEILTRDDWARILERAFIAGRPVSELIKCQELIQRFVEKSRITPLTPIAEAVTQKDTMSFEPWWWKFGGRFAEFVHVHINEKIYLLNAAQLEALDKELIKEVNVSLKSAGKVKF